MSNCTPLLSLSDIQKFVELVDSNAGAKHYSKFLNLTLDQVQLHMSNLPYYRAYIKTADEIVSVRKNTLLSPKEKLAKIAELRSALDAIKG